MDELRAEVRAWIAANHPGDPGFKLPQSALEVAEDRQFDWLRDWQRKLYDAGYVGAEWPREYGGGGRERGAQRVIDQELARARTPFLLNLVALSWAGPMILRYGTEAQKRKFIAAAAALRRDLVPGLQRAGRGQRPGVAAHARGARRRRLADRRPQGLDDARPLRRLVYPARAHRRAAP